MLNQGLFSLTPWVRRILVVNAVLYLLTITVFTGRWFGELLGFLPEFSVVLQQPWTLVTYMFLHGNFLHLAFNSLMLFFFGPPVEDRMGSSAFARYYFLCGIGGAALSLVLAAFAPLGLIIGASGAIFGVMLAFAMHWPDARVYVFPLPVPVKAKWLVMALVAVDLLGAALQSRDGVAHFAHLGGFLFGFLYLKWDANKATPAPRVVREEPVRVLAHPGPRAATHDTAAPPAAAPRPRRDIYDDVDRVLDKISAHGLKSLTTAERKLLDDMSERLRRH